MRQKSSYDTVLLKKIFQENTMTSSDIASMFGCSVRKASELRKEFGCPAPKKLVCSVCGEPKALNCFRAKFPGPCIICRVKLGWEKPHQKAGPGRGKLPDMPIQTVRSKCLKCEKPFLTRLDLFGQKLNRICPICTKTNNYLGTEEGFYESIGRERYGRMRHG